MTLNFSTPNPPLPAPVQFRQLFGGMIVRPLPEMYLHFRELLDQADLL